ncbi:hypothetical protein [Rubellimicrobium arenae]|uniref:hypothetical protein n=1 Tax=Rubellimicrobium arenae TaxID=2817372 RepID=UPI001B31044B|nr:hypothetical protein [Rubellimicrobium arenae]
MHDYAVALLFGAVIVVVFAWDQFNRPSYETSRELTRLVELLTPSRMRRRTVYWRAYSFYAGILLVVYATLCAYGSLLAPALGLQLPGLGSPPEIGASELPLLSRAAGEAAVSGYDPEAVVAQPQVLGRQGTRSGVSGNPAVPLFVSLVIVGLAPSVPILQRFEEKIRFGAHRLSGIPTRLVRGGRRLRMKPMNVGTAGLLIPPRDWQRLETYPLRAAEAGLSEAADFREDMTKVFAIRAWVLQERLSLGDSVARENLAQLEGELTHSINRLVFTLDTLSGFEAAHGAGAAIEPENLRAAWEAATKEAAQLCTDLCMLVMLYVEHGVLPTDDDAERLGWGAEPDAGAPDGARQKAEAERRLIRLLSDAARYVDRENVGIVVWVRATAAVLLVAFLYGVLGRPESASATGPSLAGGNPLALGFLLAMSAMLTYALALLVAISWQQSAYQSGAWPNPFTDHWVRWLPQLAGVFVMSGLAAAVCVVGYNIYATIATVGLEKVLANWSGVLFYAIAYEGPRIVLGPALGISLLLLIDAWRGGARGEVWLPRLPYFIGAVMFVLGAVSRLLVSQVAAGSATDFSLLSVAVLGRALAAGIVAGLIGLAAAIFVRATLRVEFARAKEPRSGDGALQPAE